MFTSIVVACLILITFLTFYQWSCVYRFSSKIIHKNLKIIGQHISLEEWEKAKKLLNPLLKREKGGRLVHLYQIRVLRGTKKLKEAFLYLQQTKLVYPEDVHFLFEEGKVLLGLNKPQEALSAFQLCLPLLRTESDAHDYATVLYQCGGFAECLEYLKAWLATTTHGPLIALAGDAYFCLNHFTQAIAFYQRAIKENFITYSITFRMGYSLRMLQRFEEAEGIFRQLLQSNLGDLEALIGLGACMQAKGQFHKALALYRSNYFWKEGNPRLLSAAGICALHLGFYHEAESYFASLLQNEKTSNNLTFYALSLEGQKKWVQAEEIYLQIMHYFPGSLPAYRALAWMFGVGLSTQISPKEGVEYANISLKLLPDSTSWEILSACEARVGNFSRAYKIQETLSKQDLQGTEKTRRQSAMRTLRKQLPLNDNQVVRKLVA